MLDILLCIRDGHDPKFVLLAASVCVMAALTSVLLIQKAKQVRRGPARYWLLAAGASAGFGIWATHFIAMLGYTPGMIAGYAPALTLLSLLIPIVTTSLALRAAVETSYKTAQGDNLSSPMPLNSGIVAGAVIMGLGISAMHYCGMAALTLPARMHWDAGYVIASVIASIVPLIPALHFAMRRDRHRALLAGTGFIALAVVGLHFTGMTALSLTPERISPSGLLIAPNTMAILVSACALGVVIVAILALGMARRSEKSVRESERQFALLQRGITDCAIYMLDASGHVSSWNIGAERLKGYRANEILGMSVASFYTPEDRADGLPAKTLATAEREGKWHGRGWRMRRDGSRFWAEITLEAVHDDKGALVGFAKITRDITQVKADQDRIAEIGRQRDAALGHMHQGLCLFDANERLVLRNARFLEMYGLDEDSLPPGTTLRELIVIALTSRLGQAPSADRIEVSCQRIHAGVRDLDHTPIHVAYPDDFAISLVSRGLPDGGWVSTFDDITHQRRSEARIAHMAMHDGLTGLPNRTRFNIWLDDAIEHAARSDQNLGIGVIDLDRFKDINDTFGHAWGDVVLTELASRISGALGENEIASRLGGDEFGIAKLYSSESELADFLSRIEGCFARPVEHDKQELDFGASIGVSAFPADGEERETLLNNADLAMYRAKAQLGDTICYYEPSMDENARARRKLANDLRQAIEREELTLLYQPQCFINDGRLSGYEALLRWQHPTSGVISPVEFIPIAEETGQILAIGEWVLREACREASNWPNSHRVAVNLSPIQLVQPELPALVTRILLETGLSPRRLELEITESAIITDKDRALHNLRQIKALGVAIAMDDFGTGYSSLDTLHSFPFDKIKIDKSFLLQSDQNEQARAIIRAVLALGQSLSIPVLAEGVETASHFDLLVNEGCQEAQGYYLGRPGEAPSVLVSHDSGSLAQATLLTANG